jgi:hypothetical protein
MAPAANAGLITIGSPLTGEFRSTELEKDFTIQQTALSEPGALVRSPVNGIVVRWRALGLDEQGPYRLRVLHPAAGGAFTGTGTGPEDFAKAFPGASEFPVNLPIKAGDAIGLDISDEGDIAYNEDSGASVVGWTPFLGDGVTLAPTIPPEHGELAFNAAVQPAPTVTAVAPASGSFKGGTAVAIEGADFTGVSTVAIGGVPVAFTVESETKLTVVTPAVPKPVAAAISVTTAAGTGVAPTTFSYEACKVPNLTGKKTKAARKKLRAAHCKLGHVKRIPGSSGKVTKQKPKPGTLRAPGVKVKLTLG